MRAFTLPVLALWLMASCAAGTADPTAAPTSPKPPKRYDAATFFETTSLRGASFSPDGKKLLFSSDATGVFNAYAVSVSGGEPEQLTQSTDDSIFALDYFPEDERFLYTADQGGNELNHVYVRALDGSVRDLTPGENLKARFRGWTQDRSAFWVMTNERDPKNFDLYRYDAATYERTRVFENNEAWAVGAMGPKGRWLALIKVLSNDHDEIYLWDSESPKTPPRRLSPEGKASRTSFDFTPDGKSLVYGTNAHGEFREAWTYNLETGKHEPLIRESWDVTFVAFSEQGRYRIHGVNADARTVLKIYDITSGSETKLPDLPPGDLTGLIVSRDEKRIGFYLESDAQPRNLFTHVVGETELVQLTRSLNAAMDATDLVEAEVVRYPSFDELPIPALLYRPHGSTAENPTPALVFVHGGPGGQSRHGYRGFIQHLVNHGYAVLAVNNRGSSGYGKTFYHADDRKHGDVDLKDCVWGRKYLQSLDWVAKDSIGIIGGSYGGFMVVAALAFEPEAFDLGIDIFGVTNWLRTLESIPPWWASFREYLYAELGDPEKDRDALHAKSPLFHAKNIRRPLLVVQGANDPRVIKAESDEIVAAAKANGVPVEYLVFDDEGHGFRKRENRIAASEAYLTFLRAHLSPK